jgi:hypothetical protein
LSRVGPFLFHPPHHRAHDGRDELRSTASSGRSSAIVIHLLAIGPRDFLACGAPQHIAQRQNLLVGDPLQPRTSYIC